MCTLTYNLNTKHLGVECEAKLPASEIIRTNTTLLSMPKKSGCDFTLGTRQPDKQCREVKLILGTSTVRPKQHF